MKYLWFTFLLLAFAVGPSPVRATPMAIFFSPYGEPRLVAQQDECGPWECSYEDSGVLYCFNEGDLIQTPGATFVCRCYAQGTDGCSFDYVDQ